MENAHLGPTVKAGCNPTLCWYKLSVLVLSKLHAVPTLPCCLYHPKSQLCNAYVLDAGRWLKTSTIALLQSDIS